ncbi:aminotransferase A [Neobacillus drentensis]|uniref:aminotransferase A n=1 Tax=Neobacillus drentensis TaxID=220684 RepID=UPI000825103B|nr:aminotransferase A [Neobacillus drentensis]MDR7240089.1 aminotransferase [Neobacillus drentensis]
MLHLVNKNVRQIELSGIRKVFNKVLNDPSIVNLTVGQPDFPTPENVINAGIRSLEEKRTGYTTNSGLPDLRKAIASFVDRRYGLKYEPENEILVTIGASEALDIAFRTILDEGSEVILPAPIYPAYEPLIRLCGAIPVFIDTRETSFKLNAEMIKAKLTDKTRCVLLPYPSNPCGSILEKEELQEIADLLRDKEIFIISDEIYSELTYGTRHHSIASFPEMKEKSIVINGLSKSHAMTGWRIGYALAPNYLIEEMLKIHVYNTVCATSTSQYAALEALSADLIEVELMKEEYQKRRDYVFDRVKSMGLDVSWPDGAFYLFPSIKKTGMSSEEFNEKLIEQAKAACIPGSAFSSYGEGYIRISYANSMENLVEGLNRLEKFLENTNIKMDC